jgi:hypothetical protein
MTGWDGYTACISTPLRRDWSDHMSYVSPCPVLATWLCLTCATASAEALPRIVEPAPATSAEQLARKELGDYLAKIKPASLAIQTAAGRQSPAEIVVCRQDSTAARDVQPPLPKLPPEGYALAMRKDRIYLVGADDRSTLYAVYDFLNRLGCRWLAPAFAFYKGDSEFVPQAPELVLSLSDDVVCRPALAFRKLYVEEGHSHDTKNLLQLVAWMPKLRFNTLVIPIDYQGRGRVRWDNWRDALTPELKKRGIIIEVGGHGYQNFLNAKMDDGRLFREHPEWFAMETDGRRTASPGWVLCSSNPDAVARLQANAIAYLKERPEIQIFDFWPPDGARWCTCAKCGALGSPSERHSLLVSQMALALRKELPSVRLECIAYSSYLEPPATAIDKSVLVDLCPIGQSFEAQIYDENNKSNRTYAAALSKWRESFAGDISIYSYYRKYAWISLPNIIPDYIQKDLQYYRRIGVKGVSSYAEPGDWFTYELNHYTLGRLAWDPDADVEAIIREFCEARYGRKADVARGAFETLEAVVRKACSIPGTTLKAPDEYDALASRITEQRRNVASSIADEPANAALTASLRRLDVMLEYVERDINIQRARAVDRPLAERKAMAEDLVTFLRGHAEEGVIVLRGQMDPQSQYKRYGIIPR